MLQPAPDPTTYFQPWLALDPKTLCCRFRVYRASCSISTGANQNLANMVSILMVVNQSRLQISNIPASIDMYKTYSQFFSLLSQCLTKVSRNSYSIFSRGGISKDRKALYKASIWLVPSSASSCRSSRKPSFSKSKGSYVEIKDVHLIHTIYFLSYKSLWNCVSL